MDQAQQKARPASTAVLGPEGERGPGPNPLCRRFLPTVRRTALELADSAATVSVRMDRSPPGLPRLKPSPAP